MGYARMVGLDRKQFLQNCSCLLSIGKRRIVIRFGSEQRKRVESSRFAIVGITLIRGLHGFGVSARPIMKVAVVAVVERVHSRDIVAFTLGLRMQSLCGCHLFLTSLH